jgi:pyruvate/2-oxoglutarate dehydrogenase complex dihydrolipoamide acyltransferase (E2) component
MLTTKALQKLAKRSSSAHTSSLFVISSRFIAISQGRSLNERLITTLPFFENRKMNEISSKIIRQSFSSKIITENLESLGDSITSAVVVSWAKEPGDSVKEDDVISIVETDKVTMDIRAKKNGVFVEGLVAAQSEITVGSPLYKIDISVTSSPPINAETVAKIEVPPLSPAASASPTLSILTVDVPVMGESITTGMLAKWNVKVGDFVGTDAVVANIETDKVNVEVRSPQSGYLKEIFNAEGDEISVGNPLFVLSLSEVAPVAAPIAPAAPAPIKAPVKSAPEAPAPAPVVKVILSVVFIPASYYVVLLPIQLLQPPQLSQLY